MKRKKRQKKKSLTRKFLNIVLSILGVYFVLIVFIFGYSYINFKTPNKENPSFVDKTIEKLKPNIPERTIALLACTDEGEGRTDGIMLVSYNSIDKKITILSIPRDTKVEVPSHMWNVMVKNFPAIRNQSPVIKINAIPNFGKEQGMEFLQETIENMLGIKINYYAHFNLEGFKYIIDSVGDIEFDVPQRMYHRDPDINLFPGVQMLDGNKAEQLLRYRTYPQGDLKRVEVQQEFMKAFFEKVLSVNSIMSNPKAYLTTLIKYVDTNFSIGDALKYIPELPNIDSTNVENYTLPISGLPNIGGVSYVEIDKDQVLEFGYELFKKETIRPEDIVYEDSFDKSIQILNGSLITGLASKTREFLEENGYLIAGIGDSQEKKVDETRIYVSKEGQGTDLEKYFINSKIIVNPLKTEEFGYDIVIILGKNDRLIDSESVRKDI